jgi:hypothetical protein
MLHSRVIARLESGQQGRIKTLPPDGFTNLVYLRGASLEPLRTGQVEFRFERALVRPSSHLTVDSRVDERLFGMYPEQQAQSARFIAGEADALSPQEHGLFLGSQFTLHNYPEGRYTILNVDENPISLYFLRLVETDDVPPRDLGDDAPVAPIDAALQPVTESLLDMTIDPALLGALSPEQWDRLDFSLVHIEPGDRFSTDHPAFSCCPGLVVFQVLEGSIALVVDGIADVIRAGSDGTAERFDAGVDVALGTGDAAIFALDRPAVVTNTSNDRTKILAGYIYAHAFVEGAQDMCPGPAGYFEEPVTKAMAIDHLTSGPVHLSFERTMLEPGAALGVEVVPDVALMGWHTAPDALVRLIFGAHDPEAADSTDAAEAESFIVQTFSLSNFAQGTYTFVNEGDEPVALYFLRLQAA